MVSRWASTLKDAVRSSLWPLPTAGVALAVVAGILMPALDERVDGTLPGWAGSVLFAGDAGAARTVLDAVSSSLITVTSLTFSLTVVTLQLASSQFSPRLLRTFTRDIFVQATLAVFVSTFVYALTVLRAVRDSGAQAPSMVPRISVSLAFVLAVASVIVLILFLAHLAQQIRVETMLRNVHQEATTTISAVLQRRDTDPHLVKMPTPPPHAVRLLAPSSGFLIRVDEHDLTQAASNNASIIVITKEPGEFLVEQTPIGWAWRPTGDSVDADDALAGAVADAVHTDVERTAGQDVAYGLRQLTDVTNKALSPGINDPTTAVHALGHISSLLCNLAQYRLGPVELGRGAQGSGLVYLARPDFDGLLENAIEQPRRYGASDPQLITRLYLLLTDLAHRVPTEHAGTVSAQIERLGTTARAQDFDQAETARLTALHDAAREVLGAPRSGTR